MDRKEEILKILNNKDYKPLKDTELTAVANVRGKDAAEFLNVLDEMEASGEVWKTQKGKYTLPEALNLVVGRIAKHKKGFGFLIPDIPGEKDIFISKDYLIGSMNEDRVAVRVFENWEQQKNGDNREGEVVKILKRANHEIVGTLQNMKNNGFVIPLDPKLTEDIFVLQENMNLAKDGDIVVVKVTKWANKNKKSEGKIIEVVAEGNEYQSRLKGLIRRYNLKEYFPEEVEGNADTINTKITDDEISKRKDFRKYNVVTIDGADAKDLDDGISIYKNDKGNYVLGVHIADVSHYVQENMPMDEEALKRGCSVYLIDTVIPMLPKKLSNGVCSLNPNEDRLTLSVEIEFDANGNVLHHELFEGIIHSKERLVYTEISDIIEKNDKALIKKYEHIYDDIKMFQELAMTLRELRQSRGSIDFDIDEAYISLNENGVPVSIETAERRTANRIIEEFMIKANEVIAEHFYWMEIPFVYRVHDNPSSEKIDAFKNFIYNFGYKLKGSSDQIHPRLLNELLKKIEGKPEEHVINTIMLRSMQKAAYSVDCTGHFGLGLKYYCHFTSPIRRYPDLMIHRMIKKSLNGELTDKECKRLIPIVLEVSEISSAKERNSEEIERELEKLKKAEYMFSKVGETYDGIISGVIGTGFFVEIENTIEGMVRASSLSDDFYRHEPEKYRLLGDRTKKTFTIGDKVQINVDSVDIENSEINFAFLKKLT